MKKRLLFISAFLVVGMISCSKDHTCNCTVSTTQELADGSSEETQNTSQTTSMTINGKKSAAKAECEEPNNTVVQYVMVDGVEMKQTITTSCALK